MEAPNLCMNLCMHVLNVWLLSKTEKKQHPGFYFSYPFSLLLSLMAVLISVFIERNFGFVTHPRRSLLCIIAFSK